MAKKFGLVNLPHITVDEQGKKGLEELTRETNRALEQIVGQVNDVLQRATATLTDMALWTRGEIHTIRGSGIGVSTDDHAIRHGLGKAPKYWIPLNFAWVIPDGAGTSASLTRSDTTWTNTHVFFKVGNTDSLTYTILLIP